MKKLSIEATIGKLKEVAAFLDDNLNGLDLTAGDSMQIEIAVEEIYSNICYYAYGDNIGTVEIGIEISECSHMLTIIFVDSGKPYNPLQGDDPDITIPIKEREMGGMGVFMVKQIMDEVLYENRDGQNILTLKKLLETN